MKCGAAFEKRSHTTRRGKKLSSGKYECGIEKNWVSRRGVESNGNCIYKCSFNEFFGFCLVRKWVLLKLLRLLLLLLKWHQQHCALFQMVANCKKFSSAKNFELLFYIPFEFPISLSVRYECESERNIWLTSTNQNDYKKHMQNKLDEKNTFSATDGLQIMCVCVCACENK